MEQRYVGSSGLQVSRLALGTMGWGGDTEHEDAARLLASFLDAGGTTIEVTTGFGDAAPVLGECMADAHHRADLVLVARSGRWGTPAASISDLSRRGMLQALDTTLAALGTDHVDLWLAHGWSDDVPLEETISALSHALTTGRARYIGVSDHRGWQAARAVTMCPDLVAASTEWSLVHREPETELVPACSAMGVGVLAWASLGRGVLTGKYRTGVPGDSRAASEHLEGFVRARLGPRSRTVVEAVATAADGLGTSPSGVALAWLWQHDVLATAVVGPRTPGQLDQLLGLPEADLPPEIVSVLDEVSATPA